MKSSCIPLLSDRIVVNPSSRAPAGYGITHGPLTRLSLDADPVTMAEAVKCSLLESRVDVRPPEDLRVLSKERLASAGVRSERAYHKDSSKIGRASCRERVCQYV